MELMDMHGFVFSGDSNQDDPVEVGTEPVLVDITRTSGEYFALYVKGRTTGNHVQRVADKDAIFQIAEVEAEDGKTTLKMERIF